MLKALYLVKRRPDWSFDAFRDHEVDTHVPLALALPGLRRYEFDVLTPIDGQDQPYDGVATLWFDDKAAHDAALASEAGQKALADLPVFLDTDRMLPLFGETVVARDDL
jgi:uncharacterized protein (TIGR02118 family)